NEAAEEAVDQLVEVDQAEADRHRQHQQEDATDTRIAPFEAPAEAEGRMAEVPGRDRQLHRGADQDADRIGVDPVLLREHRLEDDQHEDDRHVPEERRDREGAEAVVAVEDADDDAADPEHDQDREEDPREGDREVHQLWLVDEAGREERDHDRGREDEDRGDRAEDRRDQEQQGRGEAEGLFVLLAADQVGEDGDEGGLQGGVGEQRADQVGDLEGDREGRHRTFYAEVAGGDDFARQTGDPRERGGGGEERGRPRDAAALADPRGRQGEFLARVERLGLADRNVGVDGLRAVYGGVGCLGSLQAAFSVAIVGGRPWPRRAWSGTTTWPT